MTDRIAQPEISEAFASFMHKFDIVKLHVERAPKLMWVAECEQADGIVTVAEGDSSRAATQSLADKMEHFAR